MLEELLGLLMVMAASCLLSAGRFPQSHGACRAVFLRNPFKAEGFRGLRCRLKIEFGIASACIFLCALAFAVRIQIGFIGSNIHMCMCMCARIRICVCICVGVCACVSARGVWVRRCAEALCRTFWWPKTGQPSRQQAWAKIFPVVSPFGCVCVSWGAPLLEWSFFGDLREVERTPPVGGAAIWCVSFELPFLKG